MLIRLFRDDPETFFSVALDDLTVARLMELADICQNDPCSVIAAIVKDVLEDDARAHNLERSTVQ